MGRRRMTAEQAVDALIAVFDHEDIHAPFSEDSVVEIMRIGQALNDAGGMNLMLLAHEMFAARRRQWARALEGQWDGIGGWMG